MRLSQRRFAPLIAIAAIVFATACAQHEASPIAAPSPIEPPPAGPAPSIAPIKIGGRVRETAPTETTGIRGATVRVSGGANAGRTVVTDEFGFYTIRGLEPGTFTLDVAAEGFVASSELVAAQSDTTVNFNLARVPRTMTHTSTGTIAATDGTCSDGISMKACRILAIPVHNPGTATATLSWTAAADADLDLTLFQTGVSTPLARSNESGRGPERISAALPGGARYEFRVTWAAGAGAASYTLEVSYPD